MSTFKNADGKPILLKMVKGIQDNKAYLGEVDGLIGDGDHGMNMNKGFSVFEERFKDQDFSFSEGLDELGTILLNEIGGSMGPIYGTILMDMAEAGEDVENIGVAELADMLKAGLDGLCEIVDAKVGDKIEFQIEYTNTSSERQDGVAIKDILPANLRYIEGSTKIKNANYANGKTISEGYLITDGLEIGSYNPDSNAYLMFTAEVVDDDLSEGLNTIENIVSGGIENVIIEDSVKINIQNNKGYDTIITVHVVLIAICFCVFIIMLLLKIFRRSQKQES